MSTEQLPEQYLTRPGTPMTGPYSTNQMDDFYAALGRGEAKPSGLMNLLQHLLVAERCAPNARVLDVCCGRGLALPLLYRYAPGIERYVGLDISAGNLGEARERVEALRATYGSPFPVDLVECDVAARGRTCPRSTSQSTPRRWSTCRSRLGVQSLRNTAAALAPGGVLYLPRRRPSAPRPARCSTASTSTSGRATRPNRCSATRAWSSRT